MLNIVGQSPCTSAAETKGILIGSKHQKRTRPVIADARTTNYLKNYFGRECWNTYIHKVYQEINAQRYLLQDWG